MQMTPPRAPPADREEASAFDSGRGGGRLGNRTLHVAAGPGSARCIHTAAGESRFHSVSIICHSVRCFGTENLYLTYD